MLSFWIDYGTVDKNKEDNYVDIVETYFKYDGDLVIPENLKNNLNLAFLQKDI
jgi:hypothetical protein